MINKYFNGIILVDSAAKTEFDEELKEFTLNQIKKIENNMDTYHVSQALIEIWVIIAITNKYIDETKPWVLAKNENTEDIEKLKSVMFNLAENLRKIAIVLNPFMPETSCKILAQLGIKDENNEWNLVYSYNKITPNTKVVEKGEPLFMRLDAEEEINYIKEEMKK